jgi:cysteine desulfurase
MKNHYFDYAAATPMSKSVQSAMQPYFETQFYNPSAIYLEAAKTKKDTTRARELVAKILGAKQSEIIFTAGGTESDNLAIQGVMLAYPDNNCVVSAIEHEAILAPAQKFQHKVAPVLPDGRVDVKKLSSLIDDNTVFVSVMYANNEIGTIQPLSDIAKQLNIIRSDRRARGITTPLYFHTDACQAANYLRVLVHSLGVDLMTLNGGKIYGPKQSGILYVASHVKLQPLMLGGGQERNLRSGTENVPAIIGFAAALNETENLRESESKRLTDLRQYLLDEVIKKFPHVHANGSLMHRLPNNIHLTFRGVDNERLMMDLDERGIMVATGSACSASNEDPSHVLKAIGLNDKDAQSSIRITLGRHTKKTDIDVLLTALSDIL